MSKEEDEKVAGVGAGCLIVILSLVVGVFMNGWVGMTLWGWFAVPLGVVPIGLWHAVGLAGLVRLLVGTSRRYEQDKDESLLKMSLSSLAYSVLVPLISLGLGWCTHQLMLANG